MCIFHLDFQTYRFSFEVCERSFKFDRAVNAIAEHGIACISVQLVAVFIAKRDGNPAERRGRKVDMERITAYGDGLCQDLTAAIWRKPREESIKAYGVTAEIDVFDAVIFTNVEGDLVRCAVFLGFCFDESVNGIAVSVPPVIACFHAGGQERFITAIELKAIV